MSSKQVTNNQRWFSPNKGCPSMWCESNELHRFQWSPGTLPWIVLAQNKEPIGGNNLSLGNTNDQCISIYHQENDKSGRAHFLNNPLPPALQGGCFPTLPVEHQTPGGCKWSSSITVLGTANRAFGSSSRLQKRLPVWGRSSCVGVEVVRWCLTTCLRYPSCFQLPANRGW